MQNKPLKGRSALHIPALDGIRGLAIWLVLMVHGQMVLPETSRTLHVIKKLLWPGWTGVDLFFVLSGFLITGILIDTKDARNYFTGFYARRVLRIFPLYYTALTAIFLISFLTHQAWLKALVPSGMERVYYYLYLSNWSVLVKKDLGQNVIGHFWSLAVEEQFYLIWPLCIWLTARKNISKVCLAAACSAALLRLIIVSAYGPSVSIYTNTFTRMDALLLGGLAATLVRSRGDLLQRITKFLPFIACSLVGGVFLIAEYLHEIEFGHMKPYTQSAGFFLIALGYSSLVLWVYEAGNKNGIINFIFRSRLLRFLGKYSYGIYVFHIPILTVGLFIVSRLPIRQSAHALAFTVLISFAATIGMAVASYQFFEKRFLRLKGRFEPSYHPPLVNSETEPLAYTPTLSTEPSV